MKILVGVDGSERSYAAAQFVSELLAPEQDRIAFYFGAPKIKLRSTNLTDDDAQQRVIDAFARDVFEEATRQLPAALQSRVETVVTQQKPVEGLISTAQQTGSDLIAVAAQNASARLSFFVGGVAHALANQADLPVLLYRATKRSAGDPVNVLYAVDDATCRHEIRELLGGFRWPTNSVGRVLHVLDYAEAERLNDWIRSTGSDEANGWTRAYSDEVENERRETLERLDSFRLELPPIFHEHPTIVVHGHVVDQILSAIESESIDLVVVGAPKLHAIARLLGSTTEGLILRARCSILIVHPNTSRSVDKAAMSSDLAMPPE